MNTNQYRAGTVSYLNVVTAQTAVLSAERSLLKRVGSPGEIAAAVLLAVRSDFMTGADVRVDGGRGLV